jgi:flagellar assembly protein FliH
MTAQPLSTLFTFDTEFDASGAVVHGGAFRPVKRAYGLAEVEALVAEARLEARNEALSEVDSIQAMALSSIAEALASAAPALSQVAQAHRQQSAELALVAARVVAASALERFPEAPLQAALEALGQEVDASPRLVIRTGDLTEATHARIQQLCADAGFSGIVAFRTEPGMAAAAFQLDPDETFARMGEALNSALAAEAGHAETLTPETSMEGRP